MVVTNPIPERMGYIGASASGPGCDIDFSVDGGLSFAKPDALQILLPAGQTRPATAADYTHIRWKLKYPLSGNAVALCALPRGAEVSPVRQRMDYKDIFSAEGPLARAIPGYAYRPEQATMAKAWVRRWHWRAVDRGGGHRHRQAFAYLVPALLSGRSIIISTGTRTFRISSFIATCPCWHAPSACR